MGQHIQQDYTTLPQHNTTICCLQTSGLPFPPQASVQMYPWRFPPPPSCPLSYQCLCPPSVSAMADSSLRSLILCNAWRWVRCKSSSLSWDLSSIPVTVDWQMSGTGNSPHSANQNVCQFEIIAFSQSECLSV